MNNDIVIVGTGGLAKELAQLIGDLNTSGASWNLLGFIGESGKVGQEISKFGEVMGDDSWLLNHKHSLSVAIGIGFPKIRRNVVEKISSNPHLQFPNLIHPRAYFSSGHVEIGDGNIITVGSVFTCDICIGSFNLFNWNCTIGHDAKIGSFNVINPGANVSGSVEIQDEVFLGTGSQVLQGLNISSGSTLGAGAVLTKSVLVEGQTLVGVPAKPLVKT